MTGRGSRRARALLAVVASGAVLCAGCAVATAPPNPPAAAPQLSPPGTGPTTITPARRTPLCDATASYRPLAPMPKAGQMPAGTYLAQIQRSGRLRVGVDQTTYLWGYRDPLSHGRLVGFDIDMLRLVARAIWGNDGKDHLVTVVVPNTDRVAAVQHHKVDIVAETMTITCDRRKHVDFSTVYYNAGQEVLVPRGSPITSDRRTLAGQRVCATSGSTSLHHLADLRLVPPVLTVAARTQADCLVMLQQGQVDAISTDDTILQGMAAQDPTLKIIGPAFAPEPYGMAIAKDHRQLTEFVNGVLESARRDGDWATIYRKWLGRLYGNTAPPPPSPAYLPAGAS